MTPQIGKFLIIAGIVLVVIGLVFVFAGRIPFLGKLPGDIYVRRGNFTLYLPIVTMLVVSLLLTIVLNLFFRGK